MSRTAPAAGRGDSDDDDQWAETVMQPLTSGRRVLRVLNGSHTGAESELVADRVLVGNLESECDIVLDVKRNERHACLIRVSDDEWTVLAIAGELWLDRDYIEPQQTRNLQPGQVLTLGRVAFSVADPDLVDWTLVKPPFELVKPAPQGPLPQTTLLPSRPAVMRKWRALMLAAGLGLSALVLASAATYLSQAWSLRTPSKEEMLGKLVADRKTVAALPFGREINLSLHPESPSKLLVEGYLPLRAQVPVLAQALERASTEVEFRVTALDELGSELTRRFEQMPLSQVRYEEQGRFELATVAALVPAHDRQVRVTLQELPALGGLALKATDLIGADGKPVVVRYERSAERPGDLVVTNLDAALGRKPFTVQEVRLGELPSVVLNDGLRYFVDARLPDGSRIDAIDAERLVIVRTGGVKQVMPFEQVSILRSATAEPPRKNRGK